MGSDNLQEPWPRSPSSYLHLVVVRGSIPVCAEKRGPIAWRVLTWLVEGAGGSLTPGQVHGSSEQEASSDRQHPETLPGSPWSTAVKTQRGFPPALG